MKMSRNASQLQFFTLTGYSDPGSLKPLFFLLLLLLYVLMLFSNTLLIVAICSHRTLHEPMYLFVCNLFASGLLGSSALFPFLLIQILRDVHVVPSSFCFAQVFVIHLYGLVEYMTLTAMSYDRYLAICSPLQYSSRMSRSRLSGLMCFPWVYGVLVCSVMISLSSSLQRCGNNIHKIYCDNFPIVRLACFGTTALNVYGLIISSVNICCPMAFILFTYSRILRVCLSGSKQTRQKALNTCGSHIASLLSFGLGGAFEVIQSRFDMSAVPDLLRVFLSLHFLVVQPLLDPFMHGLNVSKIRLLCKSLLLARI